MNKAYTRCLFTRLPGILVPVHPAVGWIVGYLPGSHANNIYSPGSDKLTDVQLYMSISCQLGSRVIRAFSNVEKPFFLSKWESKQIKSLKFGINTYLLIRTEQNTTFISSKSQYTQVEYEKKKTYTYDETVDNMETIINNLSYLPD